ncbi:DUF1534 domain-containing protein [Pseudomonas amygdali pv. morsprunorum]|nr:DUF1534 domain-containing protein [Pseudomonas amygdali pv. morsprunorum]POP94001.1 DUF1534 domain-containing protein [Pseudomonas amygdali pv. morsprunorum]
MRLSFRTLQRGNAMGDAPRRRYVPRRKRKTRRRASHDS